MWPLWRQALRDAVEKLERPEESRTGRKHALGICGNDKLIQVIVDASRATKLAKASTSPGSRICLDS